MLSPLQIAILKECYESGGKISRGFFLRLYKDKKLKTPPVKIITQSLERLVRRGYIVAYCLHKLNRIFIESVRITAAGGKAYKRWWLGRQKRLPL